MSFYFDNPEFSSLNFMLLDDHKFIDFIIKKQFDFNKEWSEGNPVLHLLLANELFGYFSRVLTLMPVLINPNLCDGEPYGKKSLLIILVMLVSSGTLPLQFIEYYAAVLDFDYQDMTGRTALHYAVILGRADIVTALVERGASQTILDAEGYHAWDYLFCGTGCIQNVLKKIDIDPDRDVVATRNQLKDHLGRPLILQGLQWSQQKNIVAHVIQGMVEQGRWLIKYVHEGYDWGTFIGDDCESTYFDLLEFAENIAEDTEEPLENIFVNQPFSAREQSQFIEYLLKLHQSLSGVSVLAQCLLGHDLIYGTVFKDVKGVRCG